MESDEKIYRSWSAGLPSSQFFSYTANCRHFYQEPSILRQTAAEPKKSLMEKRECKTGNPKPYFISCIFQLSINSARLHFGRGQGSEPPIGVHRPRLAEITDDWLVLFVVCTHTNFRLRDDLLHEL